MEEGSNHKNSGKINMNNVTRLMELDSKASVLDYLPEEECLENYNRIVRESSAITTKDTAGSEVLLDAIVLTKASTTICNKVKNLKIVESEFGWKELALTASQRFNNPEIRGQLLACDIFGGRDQDFHFNSMVPLITVAESEPKTVKRNNKRVRDVVMDQIEPEKIKKTKKKTTNAPSKIFNVIKKVYAENGNQPINFYNLILNPDSFTATVENLFYTSFLFNDGYIKLDFDSDKNPLIEPIVKNNQSEPVNQTINTDIFSIKKSDWKMLLDNLKIDHAMLPRLND